mgnify:CR=1 FL=1
MPDLRLLQIDSDLECEFNGKRLRIRSERAGELICELPDAKTLFALRQIGGELKALRKIGRWLNLIEQTVDVLVDGKLIARFGRDANSRLLSVMGVPSTELRLWKFLTLVMND